MKKRIFSFALCLVLALSLLPVCVLAEDITSVYISGVDHPIAGQPLDSTYSIPSVTGYEKNSDFAEILWYDLGKNASFPGKLNYAGPDAAPLASGAAAEAGHTYVAALHLRRTGSDMFPKKNFTVNTSDDMKKRLWGVYGCSKETSMSSYEGAVFLLYKGDTAYDEWNTLFLDTARDFKGYVVAGQSIWQAEEFSGLFKKGDFNLTAAWKQGSSVMTPGEKFFAGFTYTLTLTLTSPKYTNNVSFLDPLYVDLANGAAGAYANVHSPYHATVSFTFPCKEPVTELDIEGIKPPMAGEAMQTNGFTVAPGVATVKSAEWNIVGDGGKLTPAGGSFAPNTRYRLLLTIAPADGWFLSLSKIFVGTNAGTASFFQAYPDGEAVVGIDFDVGSVPNAPVSAISVDVNAPKAGELPAYVATVGEAGCNVYADDGGSYIGGVCWLDVTEDPKLTDDERVLKNHKFDPFIAGHTYQIIIELAAQEGYQFSDTPVATLNGQPTPETFLQGEILRVVYTFQPLPAVLTGITVTTPPEKTAYNAGDVFDAAGMTVTAHYSDGSSKAVTGFSISPAGALSEADTEITVIYSEDDVVVTAATPITVKKEGAITAVDLTFDAPKSGEKASLAASVPDGANYAVKSVDIFCDEDEAHLKDGDVYGKKTYIVNVTLTAAEGFHFADETVLKGTLNGEPAQARLLEDGSALVTKYFPLGYVNPFEDVKESDYFYDAVLWAYYSDPQITVGVDASHFGPKSTVTRGQAVTFLWRAMGCPEPESKTNPFADVRESDYYYKPVLWAVEQGITVGTDAAHFTPMQTCSTAHILTFLYRTLGIGDNGWYEVAEGWAKGAGLLNGLDITVAPGVDCPRADVVLFLYRVLA